MPPLVGRPRLKFSTCIKERDYKYPLLMKSSFSGVIVNMTSYGTGTVVGTGNIGIRDLKINEELVSLNMDMFRPITEKNIKVDNG